MKARLALVADWLRETRCGLRLRGHDDAFHVDRDQLVLRCVSCGRETDGIPISIIRPRITVPGDLHRLLDALPPRLIAGHRRMA